MTLLNRPWYMVTKLEIHVPYNEIVNIESGIRVTVYRVSYIPRSNILLKSGLHFLMV